VALSVKNIGGAYSIGQCSGFSPDSLLISISRLKKLKPKIMGKSKLIIEITRKIFK